MPRFDFECKDGHITTLWDDEARFCGTCGSRFLAKVFLDPPMIGTQGPGRVDKLLRAEFDARGITNIQGGGHEGDKEKITYKSTPAELAAQKIEKDFPQMKDPSAIEAANRMMQQRWGSLGVKGVINSGLSRIPEHDRVKAAIVNAGRHDRDMTNRVRNYGKNPEQYQVPQNLLRAKK